jgi:uncharacterized protein (TIGR03435 family)
MKAIALSLFVCLTAVAQHFEVASVKVAAPAMVRSQVKGGPGSNDPGQITYTGMTLSELLRRAYSVQRQQIAGPRWMEEGRFDIVAKLPAGTTKRDLATMLQNLLEERFGLAAHRETRIMPTYSLVIGKDGPKFKPTPKEPDPADKDAAAGPQVGELFSVGLGKDGNVEMPKGYRGTMVGMIVAGKDFVRFKGESMADFAKFLTEQMDYIVIDKTELKEKYDFAMSWQLDPSSPMLAGLNPAPPMEPGILSDPSPSLTAALTQQLGLKVEPRKSPVEMVVVDRLEKLPTEN